MPWKSLRDSHSSHRPHSPGGDGDLLLVHHVGGHYWEVRRTWQRNGHGEPAGAFLSYPLASVVAALLPYRDFPQGYAVHLGFIRNGGPGKLKRFESVLRVSEYLASNPEALAAVLEAAGYAVVVEALATVAGRVSA